MVVYYVFNEDTIKGLANDLEIIFDDDNDSSGCFHSTTTDSIYKKALEKNVRIFN